MTATGMGRTWVYARLQELAADGRVTQISRGRWTVTDRRSPGETVVRADVRDARTPIRAGARDGRTSARTFRSGGGGAPGGANGARRLVSLAAAAAYADVSTRTLRRYISQGRLTGYRVAPGCEGRS